MGLWENSGGLIFFCFIEFLWQSFLKSFGVVYEVTPLTPPCASMMLPLIFQVKYFKHRKAPSVPNLIS
jgi:hypothetical protein